MPKPVRIPGRGVFDFPDNMSDEEIDEYIYNTLLQEHKEQTTYNVPLDVAMGTIGGAANLGIEGLQGLSRTVGLDSAADWLRSARRANEERLLGFGPEMPGTTAAQVGQAIGSTGAYYGLQFLPGGALVAGALGAGSGMEEQRRRMLEAEAAGRDVGGVERGLSVLGGGLMGTIDVLPAQRFLGRLGAPTAKVLGFDPVKAWAAGEELTKIPGWKGWARHMGRQAVEEGLQEGAQEFGQNAVENIYNQNRALFENVPSSTLMGAAIGGGFGGVTSGLGRYVGAKRLANRAPGGTGQTEASGVGPPEERAANALNILTTPGEDVGQLLGGAVEPRPGDIFGAFGGTSAAGTATGATQPLGDLGGGSPVVPPAVAAEPGPEPKPPAVEEEIPGQSGRFRVLRQQDGSYAVVDSTAPELPRVNVFPEEEPARRLADRMNQDAASAAAATAPQPVPTPAAAEAAPAAEDDEPHFLEQQKFLSEQLAGLKPQQNLLASIVRDIRTKSGQQALGLFDAQRGAIEVLFTPREPGEPVNSWRARVAGRLRHEFIHYLRNAGVFTEGQWKTLLRESRQRGHAEEAQRLYKDQAGYTPEKVEEEGVSFLFQDTATRTAPSGFIERMWERILNTVGRVGNVLMGRGYRTADDVFADILSGKVAQQPSQAALAAAAGVPGPGEAVSGEGAARREAYEAWARQNPQEAAAREAAAQEAARTARESWRNQQQPPDRFAYPVTGEGGRKWVYDKQQGRWVPAVDERGPQYLLPVEESPLARDRRASSEHSVLTEIDAKAFQDAWEGARGRSGEKLAWNKGRSERLRDLPSFDAHPMVYVDELGRVEVTDGRHRIAEAARRGESIVVSMHPESNPLPKNIVKQPGPMYALARTMEDLDRNIPEDIRVVSPDPTRTIGGGKFSELPDLNEPGEGMQRLIAKLGQKGAEDALAKTFRDAVRETDRLAGTKEAADVVKRVGLKPPTLGFWDKALQLPKRARYWYEVSGEDMTGGQIDIPRELQPRFINTVAGTSGGVEPRDNMKRAISATAEHLQGLPIQTDLRDPASLRAALADDKEASTLKYGSFGGTMQYTSGLSRKKPLTTNDVQVAAYYGIPGDVLAKNPILYEVISRHHLNIRNLLNSVEPAGSQPWEAWQLQAPGWVHMRGIKDPSKVGVPDDYAAVLPGIIRQLSDAGVPVPGGKVTLDTLLDPRTPSIMSSTRETFTQAPWANIPVLNFNSPLAQRAHTLVEEIRGQKGYGGDVDDFNKISRRVIRGLGLRTGEEEQSLIGHLLSSVLGQPVDVSRISMERGNAVLARGQVVGSINIPLVGAGDEGRIIPDARQRRTILSYLGQALDVPGVQATITNVGDGDENGVTIFAQSADQTLPPDQLKAFHDRIGVPVDVQAFPNGFVFNVPLSEDVTEEAVYDAFGDTIGLPNYATVSHSVSDTVKRRDYGRQTESHNAALAGRISAGDGTAANAHESLGKFLAGAEQLRTLRDQKLREWYDRVSAKRQTDKARQVAKQEETAAKAARAEARAQRQAAQAAGVQYALPREEQPKPKPLADRILETAMRIRAGEAVDSSQYDPTDFIQAQKLASESRLDLGRLAQINPDDHFNFGKLDMEERPKEQLKNLVRMSVEALGRHPKTPLPFEEIRKMAARVLGSADVLDPKAFELEDGETLKPQNRLAFGIMAKEAQAEIVRRTQQLNDPKLRESMTTAQRAQAQAEIDALNTQLGKLFNVLLPARSQDGRNLVYHRILAQGTFDKGYWQGTVKKLLGLPPQADLPENVAKPLNQAIDNAQAAQQKYDDAKTRMNEAQASGDQGAQANAKQRLKEAEQELLDGRKGLARQVANRQMFSKSEVAMSLWKAGLLTNPASRAADALSNLSFAGVERLAKIPASWISASMDKSTGGGFWPKAADNEQSMLTVRQQFSKEQWDAAREGLRAGLKASGEKLREVAQGRVAPEQYTSGKLETPREFQWGTGERTYQRWGKNYVTGVQGIQQAGDLPFRKMAYFTGLAEHARLQAIREHRQNKLPAGLTMDQRAQQLIDNPTTELETEARAVEEMMTFAEENFGSKGMNWLKRGMQDMPWGPGVSHTLDFVMPFVKVPTNVFMRVIEYSPLGLGAAAARVGAARLTDKALDANTRRMYATLLGRGLVGSALTYLGAMLAKKGLMSGTRDLRDTEGRQADEAAGRPPGAIWVPGVNQWAQIGKLSPGGNLLVAGATLWQEYVRDAKDMAGVTAHMAGAVSKTVLDMPFMMGVQTLSQALEDPGDKAGNYLKRQVGSLVPAGIARLAAAVDPVQRDLKDEGWYSDLLNRIPGGGRKFPPRVDSLGREVKTAGWPPVVGPLLDPFKMQPGYDDPLSRAIVRDQLPLSKPGKKEYEDKATYNKRLELYGELVRRGLTEALESSDYQIAETPEQRRDALKLGKTAGSQAVEELTTGSDTYKESTHDERRQMLDHYLEEIRALR